jgi:hypothetical protein
MPDLVHDQYQHGPLERRGINVVFRKECDFVHKGKKRTLLLHKCMIGVQCAHLSRRGSVSGRFRGQRQRLGWAQAENGIGQ